MTPSNLILRCYGYRSHGVWSAICLDFNLAVEAETEIQLKEKMRDAIESYVEAVLDTDDKDSIADLMMRKAPLKDWIVYYSISAISLLKELPGKIFFKQAIPFHLAGHC